MDIPGGISIKQIINNTINNVNTPPHPAEDTEDDEKKLFDIFGIASEEVDSEEINE